MKGYRTIFANILLAIVPVLELTEFRDVLPTEWLQWYALGIALANMALRMITTTPVGKSK